MVENPYIALTADIVSAHLANNSVTTAEVAALIKSVYDALLRAAEPALEALPKPAPAVPIRSSVKTDYIVCLEDGAKLKMLKRYLRTNYNLSPQEYREKWGLAPDYPMVAPSYAAQRRELAHSIGLGRKKSVAVEPAPEPIKRAPKSAAADAAHNADPAVDARVRKRRGRPAKQHDATSEASATDDASGA